MNKSIPQLDENLTAGTEDLLYVAQRMQSANYNDKKINLATLKRYNNTSESLTVNANYILSSMYCDKRWVSNYDASGIVTVTLPASVVSLEIGFVVEKSFQFIVAPNSLDKIAPIKSVAGQSISCSDIGASIWLKSFSTGWFVVSKTGNWI